MQKARGHPEKRDSHRLRADGFRVFFTPLFEVLFTFPSRYWFTIGLSGVFSLAGWSPPIRTGFHVSRPTQDTVGIDRRFAYGVVTLCDPSFRTVPLLLFSACYGPSTPIVPKHGRFGLLRFRSPLPAQSLLFSFPAGTEMFQFPAFAFPHKGNDTASRYRVAPFGDPGVVRLFAPNPGLSQLVTSFIASESQGIHRLPFIACSF